MPVLPSVIGGGGDLRGHEDSIGIGVGLALVGGMISRVPRINETKK